LGGDLLARGRGALRANIDEIAGDPALRLYGALLALTHLLSFVHWRITQPLELFITRSPSPICWPFLPSCGALRFLDANGAVELAWAYAALALAGAALFLMGRRRAGLAWTVLLALTALKAAIVLQDFRLRLNQHYMAGVASLVFLFLPRKREAVRLIVVLFYFWAGALKLNGEWLSGSALYNTDAFWIKGPLLPWACAYVVLLEMGLSWGLLARRAAIFWGTLLQFGLFHVFSWPVVGFFYPLLMFDLLAIHPLCRWLPGTRPETSPLDLLRGRAAASTWALAGGFSLLQLVPLAIPGDSAITGEGRLFAVHMFDARIECEARYVVTLTDGRQVTQAGPDDLPVRIACDPIVHWNVARNYCRRFAGDPRLRRLDVYLSSRHSDETRLRPVLAIDDFCARDPAYHVWWHNDWILLDQPPAGG
jgi:hypothetical protein